MFANLRKWSTIETPVSPLFQRRKGSIKVEKTESSSSNINNNKEEEEEKNQEKGIIKEQQQENNTEEQQDKDEEELNDGMDAEKEEVEVQVEPGPSQEGQGGGGKKIFANFRKWSSFEAPVSPLFNRKKATIKEEKAGSSSSSDKKDNDDDDHHDEEELDSAEGSDDKQESNDDQDPKDKQERKKEEEEEEEEEDLDKLLNDMDIDKDFDMWKSFKQRMESSPEKGERGGRQSLAMSEDEAHAYWQARVERDEVYSKRYRPTTTRRRRKR